MGENTKIEWATHTINFWWGCVKSTNQDGSLSEPCRNCYAEAFAKRTGRATWGRNTERWFPNQDRIAHKLRKWNRLAEESGELVSVFCNSMSDLFEARDDLNDARAFAFDLMDECSALRFLCLTKRPEEVLDRVRRVACGWLHNYSDEAGYDHLVNPDLWPSNVWIGTSLGNEKDMWRVGELLKIPAQRFLSIEPLLGPLELPLWPAEAHEEAATAKVGGEPCEECCVPWSRSLWPYCPFCSGDLPARRNIDWVIVGGESGPKARPSHPDWIRSIRDQCVAAGVPFLFKQWGAWAPHEQVPEADQDCTYGDFTSTGWVNTHSGEADAQRMWKVGKKAAGRTLDGRTWNEVPA